MGNNGKKSKNPEKCLLEKSFTFNLVKTERKKLISFKGYLDISGTHERVGKSGLVGEGVGIRIGRFAVQTPLGARPGLGIQHRYEAPGDLWVELVENAVIDIGLVRLSPREWPKVDRGTAK